MVRLVVAAIVFFVAASGCQGQLNPSYCALHREDPDCLTFGVDLVDAPTMAECRVDAECTAPGRLVCDQVNGRCVECVANVNTSACGPMELCGTDQQCHGCLTDGDCPSSVCLASQSCANAADVLYATPGGTGDCSHTAPCSLTSAVSGLSEQRHIIKLVGGTDATFREAPIEIDEEYDVQIIAKGITFAPTGSGDAITANGAGLEILGLTILNASESGLNCSSGVVTLQEVTIKDAGVHCITASDCNVNLKRSNLTGCGARAMEVVGGSHEIRNNVISNVISDGKGTVLLDTVRGRFVFNTMVNIQSPNGNKIAAVGCKPAAQGAFAVAQNLIVQYGPADNPVGSGCEVRENPPFDTLAQVGFVSATDFHLTGTSPATVLDANTPAAISDCKEDPGTAGSLPVDDIDGVPRPYNFFCDRGADEYVPVP